ncbi:MAG: hypothetical protein AAF380_00775 [Bacteroidota bacterium]
MILNVWALVHRLDSKYAYQEIIDKLLHEYSVSHTETKGHIKELQDHHFLEDNSYKVEDLLDGYTAELWSKNMEFFL